MPRHLNVRTWFYKIRPTVGHDPYEPIQIPLFHNDPKRMKFTPQQLRWKPREIPTEPTNFV
jgi:homogentisate 1,2-dioxygenase